MLPGLVSENFSKVSNELSCKIRLGPKHAYDLSFVLRFAEEVDFSEKIPACELLADVRKEEAVSSLNLKGVKLGGDSRMKVMGEIVGAAELGPEGLKVIIEAFIARGADIIDFGATHNTLPGKVRDTVSLAKSRTFIPVSIDTCLTPS